MNNQIGSRLSHFNYRIKGYQNILIGLVFFFNSKWMSDTIGQRSFCKDAVFRISDHSGWDNLIIFFSICIITLTQKRRSDYIFSVCKITLTQNLWNINQIASKGSSLLAEKHCKSSWFFSSSSSSSSFSSSSLMTSLLFLSASSPPPPPPPPSPPHYCLPSLPPSSLPAFSFAYQNQK